MSFSLLVFNGVLFVLFWLICDFCFVWSFRFGFGLFWVVSLVGLLVCLRLFVYVVVLFGWCFRWNANSIDC